MLKYIHIYLVNEIPDIDYLEYQKDCQGSVQETISMLFGYLLKRLTIPKTGDVEVTLRMAFNPASKNRSLQSRMSIFLILKTRDCALLDSLKTSIEKGGLSRFYRFFSVNNMELSWGNINEISVITREENLIKPSISHDQNYKIPPYYYSIQLFEPNKHNDYMDLDKILDKIHEIVIIDVAVKPMEIKAPCLSHANYLASLEDINNSWSINDDKLSQIDCFDNNQSLYSSNTDIYLTPLKIKDPIADEMFATQRRFSENLYDEHLAFNIRVLSKTASVKTLITSCVANSAFQNGHYQSFSTVKGTKEFESVLSSAKHLNFHDIIFSKTILQDEKKSIYADLTPLSQCGTIEELSGIFRLPVASLRSPCCIRSNTDPLSVSNKIKSISLGTDMEIKDFPIELPLPVICKHIFISGMPGSGKTTAVHNLMFNLWEHKIPFIVIETAKAEYRNLKIFKKHCEKKASNLAKHLQIYTLGNESISPFRINPLIIPKNISKDSHIATLLNLLQSAIPISGPLPSLITESLERVYEAYPDHQHPPILKDLLNTVQKVLKEKSYSLETQQDILTAIKVRLSSLISGSIGKIFQCRQNIPEINELTKAPAIIEMGGLNNEQKCFSTLNILSMVKEDIKSSYRPDNKLKFVIFIEEAHNIIGRSFNASPSPDNADPKSFVTDLICNMLAELRSLGIGIVIIDQLPSAIAPQVVKNTGAKLAFRQVDSEDRELLAAAMLLKEYEKQDLARLKPGEAYYSTEGQYRSRKIQTTNLHETYNFGTLLQNDQILKLIRNEDMFIKNRKKRIASELLILQEQMNLFDNFRVECMKNIATIMAQFLKALEIQSGKLKTTRSIELKIKASEIRDALSANYDSFVRDFFNKYLTPNLPLHINDSELDTIRQDTMNRFNSIFKPDFNQFLKILDAFIIKCEEANNNAQYE